MRNIREYIPKNKTIIHGDAHLGNFMYSDGELYFIDPDNVKISDYNADIGKVVHAIERLGDEKQISHRQASELRELFLGEYNGEDTNAVNIYKSRTPLIELKSRGRDLARRAVRKASTLEAKVSAVFILVAIVFVSLNTQNNLVGLVIGRVDEVSNLLIVLLIIAGLIAYFLLKKRRKK